VVVVVHHVLWNICAVVQLSKRVELDADEVEQKLRTEDIMQRL